ncbi:guanylate kinase-associated protein mars-like [Drosophila miranda]|uniref:guanylate kinase-associated protein mars-like n=1 Tax=Drosophila miranda TaxID=7229 RepID=UPI00143FA9E6|nr:guanylate kinase-associated protein mars-like [Drosophila miranda]
MQRHRELYKQQSLAFSPRNFDEQNRELQNAARAKQREDRFQSNRIISVSPTPVKRAAPIPPSEEAQPRLTYVAPPKENRKPELPQQQRNPTRDLYIKRFVDWKAARKEQTKNEQIARRGQKMCTYKTETLTPATNPRKSRRTLRHLCRQKGTPYMFCQKKLSVRRRQRRGNSLWQPNCVPRVIHPDCALSLRQPWQSCNMQRRVLNRSL